MCRLMLISNNEPITSCHYVVMSYLLALSERTGNTHGTGIGTNTDFIKFADTSSEAILRDDYFEWVKKTVGIKTHTLLGHTRLASGVFRKITGNYTAEEAHPFRFGGADSWGTVYHNGTFKEHEEMAKALQLPDKHELTDTAIFTRLLGAQVGDGVPSAKDLISVYEVCGKADYNMFITHNTTPDITIVRGNKPLYRAKSNYGLIINTDSLNIRDLPKVVNPGLKLMGFDPIEIETPTVIAMWTINTVSKGTFTKVQDIDDLKKISEPPIEITTTHYHRHGSAHHPWRQEEMLDTLATAAADQDKEIDVREVTNRAEAMVLVHILALDGGLGDEEVDRIFSEVYEDYGPWFSYEAERLNEICNLFVWTWANFEETKITDKKLADWNAFKKVCRKAGHYTAPSMYREARRLLQKDFSNPWFLNSPKELDDLAILVSEVVFDETADDSWPG